MRVAVDTWAFRELLAGPRGAEVGGILDEAEAPFTVHECVVETYNYILRKTGRPERAWAWWEALRGTSIRVFEPPLADVHKFMQPRAGELALSLVDWSLAYAASRERTKAILTEDVEFRALGLEPLFAR